MFSLAQLSAEVLKEQLANGVILMVLGMAIVFVFLTILVGTTKGVSKIVRKFEKNTVQVKSPEAAPVVMAGPSSDAEVAVAIAAALAKSKN